MDRRADIPPTLPRQNPTESYWQDPPDVIANLRSTPELPPTADVVVVGSGLSGACIAYELLGGEHGKPVADHVVMLEARQACSGATGRNGGHTKAASYRSFVDNLNAVGEDEAIKIARLEYDNIRGTQAFAQQHGIPCDLNPSHTVDIVYDEGVWKAGVEAIALMRRLMPNDLHGAAEYTLHSADEAKSIFLCAGEPAVGAVRYFAGSLSAYKLGIGILKLALPRGLNLQTTTAATALHQQDDGWRVETTRGTITAKRVVLATNGYTGFLYPKLRSIIVPLRGQITAQRPGAAMPANGLPTTYSFAYKDGYEYMVTRPVGTQFAGDVVIGGGLARAPEHGLLEYGTTDDTTLEPTISEYLRATTPRYFGDSWGADHPDGRVRKEWTGIMGYSPDGFPFVGALEPQLWTSASFQGHGMVLCFMCARALVAMMRGDEVGSWFPSSFRVTEERMKKRFHGKLHVGSETV